MLLLLLACDLPADYGISVPTWSEPAEIPADTAEGTGRPSDVDTDGAGSADSADGADSADSGGGVDTAPETDPVYGERICAEPLPGEPEGATDGQVCTAQSMHGCTEEGRRFTDYVSCEPLYDVRGYAPIETTWETVEDDPRLEDEDWMTEVAWAKAQVESCSCLCCHSEIETPEGPALWYMEAEPIWTDSASDYALAFFAGWVDSSTFGSLPPGQNNGFDRDTTGVPTTDIPRMQAFLEAELERRGVSREDYPP